MPTWLVNLLGGGLIDKVLAFIPNPEEKAKAQAEMQRALLDAAVKAESEQRDIDKVEAANPSLFVAGWRPAVGWLCVATLFYQWVIVPTVSWGFQAAGAVLPPLPHLESQDTQTLLYALLGIGGLRTIDKISGSDTKSVGGIGSLGGLGKAVGGLLGAGRK